MKLQASIFAMGAVMATIASCLHHSWQNGALLGFNSGALYITSIELFKRRAA
jgi:hypothetical protein